jgi:hypothetical protein
LVILKFYNKTRTFYRSGLYYSHIKFGAIANCNSPFVRIFSCFDYSVASSIGGSDGAAVTSGVGVGACVAVGAGSSVSAGGIVAVAVGVGSGAVV